MVSIIFDKLPVGIKPPEDIIVKASGDVTKEDVDIELERLFNELELNKETSDINIDIRINS